MTAAQTAAAVAESARLRRETLLARIAAGVKYCRGCDTVLPLEAFTNAPSMSDGRGAYCRVCSARRERERQQQKRAKAAAEKARKLAAERADPLLREILGGGPVRDPGPALDLIVAAEQAQLEYRCFGCPSTAAGGQRIEHKDGCTGVVWMNDLVAEAEAHRAHAEGLRDRLAGLDRRVMADRASSSHR